MAYDLRIATPIKTGDPLQVGPRDGILLPQLINNCAARLVSGTEKLVQQITLEILNDRLPDGTGSGLATALKTAPPDQDTMRRIAASGVATVKRHILANQQDLSSAFDESELLADLRLLEFHTDGQLFDMRLELTTVNGVVTTEAIEVT